MTFQNKSCRNTETASVQLIIDIMMSTDRDKPILLVLLDLSVAFDIVDPNVLFSRLEDMFSLSDKVLEWFQSYLEQHSQSVSVHGILSDVQSLLTDHPQSSVLGP